jgi:glycosyltransferase involved in cell wall biosynthesis
MSALRGKVSGDQENDGVVNPPTVSVVVPNYNHARFLRRRIDSILQQTFQDFELILLDDCSTDESRTILSGHASDPRVLLELNSANSGCTFTQWNKGVLLARGKYVWIAESDDYAEPHLLERLVKVLDDNVDVTFAYCRSQCVSTDDRILGFADSIFFPGVDPQRWLTDFNVNGQEECRTHLVRCNTVPNASAVLFRKLQYDQTGGADESLRLCGDWKLWASMALMGDVGYVAQPLNYFRLHDSSVTTTADQARVHVLEWLKVTRWILERVTPSDTVLKRVYEYQANRWVPTILSLGVPLEVKMEILSIVSAIDPHPTRRVLRPALAAVGRKISRHWRGSRPQSSTPL